jgi:hypothetical protein
MIFTPQQILLRSKDMTADRATGLVQILAEVSDLFLLHTQICTYVCTYIHTYTHTHTHAHTNNVKMIGSGAIQPPAQ